MDVRCPLLPRFIICTCKGKPLESRAIIIISNLSDQKWRGGVSCITHNYQTTTWFKYNSTYFLPAAQQRPFEGHPQGCDPDPNKIVIKYFGPKVGHGLSLSTDDSALMSKGYAEEASCGRSLSGFWWWERMSSFAFWHRKTEKKKKSR